MGPDPDVYFMTVTNPENNVGKAGEESTVLWGGSSTCQVHCSTLQYTQYMPGTLQNTAVYTVHARYSVVHARYTQYMPGTLQYMPGTHNNASTLRI